MWHWQCCSPSCMLSEHFEGTQKQKNTALHTTLYLPIYIEWIFRYLLDVKIAGMCGALWAGFDGFTISCVRWNYNFPQDHQHQMIWCLFLHGFYQKKWIFSCASNFSVKGHLSSICWYMSRHQAKKSVCFGRGISKRFSPNENASHFFISIPNCPSGT